MTAVLSVEELVKLAHILKDKIESRRETLDEDTNESEYNALVDAKYGVEDVLDVLEGI